MDNLSKPELLTLLSIMEGELEARDLVIEALRVSPPLHLWVHSAIREGGGQNPPTAEPSRAALAGLR